MDVPDVFSAGRWRVGTGMASVIRYSGVAVLLQSLLFCEWCRSHRSDVHSVFVGGERAGHTSTVRGTSVSFSVESDGWSNSLWDRVSSGVLWSWVRAAVAMVGVRVYLQRGEHHHLVGSGWCVVEVLGPVVEILCYQ